MNKITSFVLFSTILTMVFGLEQNSFHVIQNRTFGDLDTVYSSTKKRSSLACAAHCARDNNCCSWSFNRDNMTCLLSNTCNATTVFSSQSVIYRKILIDCSDLPEESNSGVYDMYPKINGIAYYTDVFCDMGDGAWTVIQRRTDTGVTFYRDFVAYKEGFGNKSNDHWIGNELLHIILSQRKYRLRVDMYDYEGNRAYAEYVSFFIENVTSNYRLVIFSYSGNAGDSITNPYCSTGSYNKHLLLNGSPFSTFDRDNDGWKGGKCTYITGWWLNWCACGNLNGLEWMSWKRALKSTRMKITPVE